MCEHLPADFSSQASLQNPLNGEIKSYLLACAVCLCECGPDLFKRLQLTKSISRHSVGFFYLTLFSGSSFRSVRELPAFLHYSQSNHRTSLLVPVPVPVPVNCTFVIKSVISPRAHNITVFYKIRRGEQTRWVRN